jgi:hypothetical protein
LWVIKKNVSNIRNSIMKNNSLVSDSSLTNVGRTRKCLTDEHWGDAALGERNESGRLNITQANAEQGISLITDIVKEHY